mmetsp:Transcript_4387/g.6259  ORF Transcript_4387/g.6259 Transcript_4387/m.6259 type:complete len:221 (-) Transcript_4387:1051-1713(-)
MLIDGKSLSHHELFGCIAVINELVSVHVICHVCFKDRLSIPNSITCCIGAPLTTEIGFIGDEKDIISQSLLDRIEHFRLEVYPLSREVNAHDGAVIYIEITWMMEIGILDSFHVVNQLFELIGIIEVCSIDRINSIHHHKFHFINVSGIQHTPTKVLLYHFVNASPGKYPCVDSRSFRPFVMDLRSDWTVSTVLSKQGLGRVSMTTPVTTNVPGIVMSKN